MARNAQTETDREMFVIELDGIVRDFDPPFAAGSYDVTFDCRRACQSVEATVELDAAGLTTLEIIPRAMAALHEVFAALAEQTRAWTGEEP